MMAIREAARSFPLRWLMAWLLLPNLVVILLWPVVGVPMQAGLAIAGVLALVVSQLPWPAARAFGVAAIILVVTTLYVCQLFAIPPLNFQLIGQFLADVRPLNSPRYMLAALVVVANVAAGVYFAPRVRAFTSRMQFLYAMVAIGLFVNLDGALASDVRRHHGSLPPAGTPVDSAVRQVALAPSADGGRHVLLIVVEALGAPVMPEGMTIFAADWDRPEWRRRYDVRHGTTRYFGSTTNGELRELCNRWAHYSTFAPVRADCLPRRFRSAGYRTTAIHTFGGEIFNRREWYPAIGFDRTVFAEDLFRAGARRCPGVFPGACDADVPALIARRLAKATEPQFVYWLTLNTHLPVVADGALGTERCTIGPDRWRNDFPALCRLFQLHHVLADRISDMAMSADFPETDILIVGDHKPPIFDRAANERFDPQRVPWIYLQAKRGAPGRAPVASAPNPGWP